MVTYVKNVNLVLGTLEFEVRIPIYFPSKNTFFTTL